MASTDKGLEEIPEGEHLVTLCDNHTAPKVSGGNT